LGDGGYQDLWELPLEVGERSKLHLARLRILKGWDISKDLWVNTPTLGIAKIDGLDRLCEDVGHLGLVIGIFFNES